MAAVKSKTSNGVSKPWRPKGPRQKKRKRAPCRLGSLADKIAVHGLIELEAMYNKPEGGDESSDLSLATVELGLDIQATDYLGGHILLLWEEGETEPVDLDEAVIRLTYPRPLWGVTAGFTGGKMYVPFGKFNSFMISDPLTLDLGETNQSAGLLTFEGEKWSPAGGGFQRRNRHQRRQRHDRWLGSGAGEFSRRSNFGFRRYR